MKSYPTQKPIVVTREKQLERAVKYHFRGWNHYQNRDLDSCLSDWRKAIRIRYKLLGERHDSTQESIDLIGTVLQRKGLADSMRRKYLKRLKKSIDHEAKGDQLGKQGKYRLALKEYQKSLDFEQEVIGRDHPVVATLYRKMAVTLKGLGQLERSTLVFCDALA